MFSAEVENRLKGMFIAKSKDAKAPAEDATIPPPSSAAPKESNEEEKSNDTNKTQKISPFAIRLYNRSRFVVREWPRDPQGPKIGITPRGKVAGNNLPLWGATPMDFFVVRRAPDFADYVTISSGSRLAAWAKEVGELEFAREEIAGAEREAYPKQLCAYGMALVVEKEERRAPEERAAIDKVYQIADGRMSARRYEPFQSGLPLRLLPEKLVVHDPDQTLTESTGHKRDAGDLSTPHIYRLHLTQKTRDAIAAQRDARARTRDEPNVYRFGRLYPPEAADKNGELKAGYAAGDAVCGMFALPPPLLSTPEAHLYINAVDVLGEGNHSKVFRTTWEIPRELAVTPFVCNACFAEALFKKLREDAPDVEIDENQPLDAQLKVLIAALAEADAALAPLGAEERTAPQATPRKVPIDVKWRTPGNPCAHAAAGTNAPPPATPVRVSVAAKLSRMKDDHLDHEAYNYQQFPDHFFEHWSGYNIIPPLHDPVPVSAVVPQFYGYYVPEEIAGAAPGPPTRYARMLHSPILLLEHCGEQVEVDDLNMDDRQECASLLFRMHLEGWVHHSFFPRNILVQPGGLGTAPVERTSREQRFRLIDFGRSVHYATPGGKEHDRLRREEAKECEKMFKIIGSDELSPIYTVGELEKKWGQRLRPPSPQ